MPELPEVETVKRGLQKILEDSPKEMRVEKVVSSGLSLRQPIPASVARGLKNSCVQKITRRAKYLLFHADKGVLISHLGMTGSWRVTSERQLKPHDHFQLQLSDGRSLVYRDPRRFGLITWSSAKGLSEHQCFLELGPEPWDELFDAEYLREICRRRRVPIKNVIMDQKAVVGVGNIYAAEALFFSGIRPQKLCHRLKVSQLEKLVIEIRRVLERAIAAGGTTISDFRQAGGSSGYFQVELAVYGKEGKSCDSCSSVIVNKVLAGRSSFYCPSCQKG